MPFFDRYRMYILKKTPQGYKAIAIKKFSPTDTTVTFEHGSYPINYDLISFKRRLTSYIFVDYDTGTTLSFEKCHNPVDPKNAEAQSLTKLVRQALSALGDNYGIAFVLLALGLGVAVGFILGNNIESIAGAFN